MTTERASKSHNRQDHWREHLQVWRAWDNSRVATRSRCDNCHRSGMRRLGARLHHNMPLQGKSWTVCRFGTRIQISTIHNRRMDKPNKCKGHRPSFCSISLQTERKLRKNGRLTGGPVDLIKPSFGPPEQDPGCRMDAPRHALTNSSWANGRRLPGSRSTPAVHKIGNSTNIPRGPPGALRSLSFLHTGVWVVWRCCGMGTGES